MTPQDTPGIGPDYMGRDLEQEARDADEDRMYERQDTPFSGTWRYWLFGFIPLRGTSFGPRTQRKRGPHIWRYLGVWRDELRSRRSW